MRRLIAALAVFSAAAIPKSDLRPPIREDADNRSIPRPKIQEVSELYAIVHNTWLRHLNVEYKALAAHDRGALNVNAWDEVPDSSWFTNRMSRRSLAFEEIVSGIPGKAPAPGAWTLTGIVNEGYTPKFYARDSAGGKYVVKLDPRDAIERNSAAERICTLILHACGYNVPLNTIVFLRRDQLRVAEGRGLDPRELDAALAKVTPLPDGSYRAIASYFIPGEPLGKFVYAGVRKDDANDLVPHEWRRELRGLRVIASWINHVDAGDKNTYDTFVSTPDKQGFVKHYLLDFGSAMGSGDFVNGPFRVGHEYIFDGPAMARSLLTFGFWQRPWEVHGEIRYPEIGYYDAALFEPDKWKPNYPNLAFERMDDGDAWWGARIVTAFSDGLIGQLVAAGEYTRPEVARHLATVLKERRDRIGRYWFDRLTPLEELALEGRRLRFRDLAVERKYAVDDGRRYRCRVEDWSGKQVSAGDDCALPATDASAAAPDRYGRRPMLRVFIQSRRRAGGWAAPVRVVIGTQAGGPVQVLGWSHGG